MISEFRGRWTRFSNYAVCSIWFEGHIYNSVEHAYQAAKTLDEDQRRSIRYLATANQAKKAGRAVILRPDWEQVKVEVMWTLLREKFSQEPDHSTLLSSGDEQLVEGNWWGDKFWGQCPLGVGENWLGYLLMQVRQEIEEVHSQPGSQEGEP